MVPTFSATLEAWQAGLVGGDLPLKVWNSWFCCSRGIARF